MLMGWVLLLGIDVFGISPGGAINGVCTYIPEEEFPVR